MKSATAIIHQLLTAFVGYFRAWLAWLANLPSRKLFIGTTVLGAVIVLVNTLVLIMRMKVNSDTVAQQLIVSQWLHGVTPTDATLGETNYLLKFPLYAVMESIPMDPALRLTVTAVIAALVAWIIITFFAYKIGKLMAHSKVQMAILAYMLLFVAVVSDHAMWLHFSNSRTIEVGLMLAILYGLMHLYKYQWNTGWTALFSLGMGVVFINDKYALYTIGAVSLVYFAIRALSVVLDKGKKSDFGREMRPTIALLGGVAVFIAGTLLINTLTPVNIYQMPESRLSSIEEIWNLIPDTIHALVTIFNANIFGYTTTDPEMISRLVHAIVLALAVGVLIVGKRINKRPFTMLYWIMAGVVILFLIGGRAVDASSDRYLILIPFILTLLVSHSLGNSQKKLTTLLPLSILVSVIVWIPFQAGQLNKLVRNDNYRTANSVTYEMVDKLRNEGIDKGYDTFFAAQTVSYMSDSQVLSVPYKCDPNTGELIRTKLLTEVASFDMPAGRTFVRVDNPTETNECKPGAVLEQLGQPYKAVQLSDGSKLLLFEKDTLRQSRIII